MLDAMVAEAQTGCDIVCASRFMPGGAMNGCPWLKAVLVRTANFTLHHLARLPTHDASNGFRLFSRRAIDADRDRIDARLLLQHRTAGEMPPARLAHRRGAGAVVPARAWGEPLPGDKVAAGLSALVPLRLRHDLSQAAAGHRAPPARGADTGERAPWPGTGRRSKRAAPHPFRRGWRSSSARSSSRKAPRPSSITRSARPITSPSWR